MLSVKRGFHRGGSGVRISDPCTRHQQLILPKMKLNGRFSSISAPFPRLRRAKVFNPTKLGPPLFPAHRGDSAPALAVQSGA